MHRILLAYDGSAGADQAVALVAALPWAPGTEIRVATVIADMREVRRRWGGLILDATLGIEERLQAHAAESVRQAAERLAATGARVETRVLVGRPPQAIAREARDAAATLIVMGARGLGPLASTFLGSVSAEVVDAAPCPVLVSRSEDVRRILFATDGSEGSRAAERHLATLLLAQRAPVTVVSVAEVFHAWSIGIAPTMVSRVLEIEAEDEARARTVHEGIATGTAERLVAQGVDARPVVRIGDPALQILATAADVRADLIVLGSRGQTGLRRLLLGSVARAVLTRATASVLIVRDGETPPDA